MTFEVDKLIDSLALIVIGISVTIKKIKDYIRNRRNKNKDKFRVEGSSKNMSLVYEKIIECRVDLGGCRVNVTQFHNGDHYYSNSSILKMSVTHETTDDSTTRIIESCQNILVSKYHKFLDSLLKEDVIIYDDIQSKTKKDDDMIMLLKVGGIQTYYAVKLFNQKNEVTGFISVSFCNQRKLDENMLNIFKDYGNMISFLLRP